MHFTWFCQSASTLGTHASHSGKIAPIKIRQNLSHRPESLFQRIPVDLAGGPPSPVRRRRYRLCRSTTVSNSSHERTAHVHISVGLYLASTAHSTRLVVMSRVDRSPCTVRQNRRARVARQGRSQRGFVAGIAPDGATGSATRNPISAARTQHHRQSAASAQWQEHHYAGGHPPGGDGACTTNTSTNIDTPPGVR